MQTNTTFSKSLFFCLLAGMLSMATAYAQQIYWVGGSGDWDDLSHWSNESAGVGIVPAGTIPTNTHQVIIDGFSGLVAGATLNVPPGNYDAQSIEVTSTNAFTLLFDGSSGNSVTMNLFGDLLLSNQMNLTYTSPSGFHNKWRFDGDAYHRIGTATQDLNAVEFLDENGIFEQIDNLLSSDFIRMHAGTWFTNGYDITSNYLQFQDTNSSNNPLTKVFNTQGSSIYVDEWYSRFTYGSLTLIGSHVIYTKIFKGSPSLSGPIFSVDEIHLLELSDSPPGGTSSIEYNNFDCLGCEVERVVVEDTGNTRFACSFTINQELVIVNTGSVIEFNGGNSRPDNFTVNGSIVTPAVSGCDGRTVFKNAFNSYTSLERASGTLNVSDAVIENIQATGGATFNLINGILQGSSSGWTINTPPTSLNYQWIGNTGVLSDWDNPSNWILSNGSNNGCLPSITDNVFISSSAQGGIRIPAGYIATCQTFNWDNTAGLTLEIDGTSSSSFTYLEISGDILLNGSANITANGNNYNIRFESAASNVIETNGVFIPRMYFFGPIADWNLVGDLNCGTVRFESGTFNTQDYNIISAEWFNIGFDSKTLNLGNSTFTVSDEIVLSAGQNSNVVINPGSSKLVCEEFSYISTSLVLNDLELRNSLSLNFFAMPITLNKLILAGTGTVRTSDRLTVEDLIFEKPGATLELSSNSQPSLVVNGGIESLTGSSNPASLRSRTSASQAVVNKPVGNICVLGSVAFQDINSQLSGVVHAPEGIDGGNNMGINFTPISTTSTLYWIAGSEKFESIQNYSSVSGGCPYPLSNPSNPTLIFDDNGLFSSTEVIIANGPITTSQLHFLNSNSTIELSISGSIETDELIVNGGDIRIQGDDLIVANETVLDSGGLLTTNLQNYNTKKFLGESGLFIARSGSTVLIND